MIIVISAVAIFMISLMLAVRSVKNELSVPEEVKKIKIPQNKKWFGAIILLKDKIVHYSSLSKSSS